MKTHHLKSVKKSSLFFPRTFLLKVVPKKIKPNSKIKNYSPHIFDIRRNASQDSSLSTTCEESLLLDIHSLEQRYAPFFVDFFYVAKSVKELEDVFND